MLYKGGHGIMPPKSLFTRGIVLDAAFKIVRDKGRDGLTARSLAGELNCSTMPVYSYLKSMKKLDTELRQKAIDLMITYQTMPRTGQPFLDMGLGYVMFAKHEKNLFRLLFADGKGEGKRGNTGKALRNFAFRSLIPKMKADPALSGLGESGLENVLSKMWIFVHGLAFLVNNNAFAADNEAYIEGLLSETGIFVIQGEIAKGRGLIR
jgi:AcrR family transcriptional regulator